MGLGRGSAIYAPLMIRNPECIEVGERVLIRDGVRLEVVRDPYGRKPHLSIGSDTGIEQNVHIVCHSTIKIGIAVAIAANCAIVDVSHPFRDVTSTLKVAERIADEDSFVEIGDGAFLGYGAVILPNVRIGHRAVIGANSVVSRDVPDFGVAAGNPAVLLEVFDQQAQKWVKASRR
ncbi:MAG: acyltransferase [Acidobacteriia bacterium]|nr:acyltransferase [Terriglobia bacterium]